MGDKIKVLVTSGGANCISAFSGAVSMIIR